MLHPSQHSGVSGNTIYNALTTVRDAIAYAEFTHSSQSIISLDFTTAFDRITHMYLILMLKIMSVE